MLTCFCFKAKKGQAKCDPNWELEMITKGLLPNPGSTTCSIFSQLSHDSSKKLLSNSSSQPSLPDVLAKNWPSLIRWGSLIASCQRASTDAISTFRS